MSVVTKNNKFENPSLIFKYPTSRISLPHHVSFTIKVVKYSTSNIQLVLTVIITTLALSLLRLHGRRSKWFKSLVLLCFLCSVLLKVSPVVNTIISTFLKKKRKKHFSWSLSITTQPFSSFLTSFHQTIILFLCPLNT